MTTVNSKINKIRGTILSLIEYPVSLVDQSQDIEFLAYVYGLLDGLTTNDLNRITKEIEELTIPNHTYPYP